MRIVIINGIEGYNNVYFNVKDWFCEQEGIVHSEANIITETALAILLEMKGREFWIPKSVLEVHHVPKGLSEWQ